ncbi:MAG: hypothetical protein PHQ12_02910 [Chthoniobacteraceae bacterium]|nr:hypothetical protein [Chthoniobacteraceae bacterium]
MDSHLLLQPFALGLELGLFLAALALWHMIRLKLELRRYKQHLSERLELDADSIQKTRREHEAARRENEQLRLRVAEFNATPEGRLQRDLEVYARAEKRMFVNVPGFAAAWENAKAAAQMELADEDAGKSLPKRVFSRLFGAASPQKEALPPSSTDMER